MNLQLKFLLFFLKVVSAEVCLFPKELNLFALDASCLGTPSLQSLPCGNALDYNPTTMWHPSSQQENYFTLHLSQRVPIAFIKILQHKWVHGYAKKVK